MKPIPKPDQPRQPSSRGLNAKPQLSRRAMVLSLASLPFARAAYARPTRYELDRQNSSVGFSFKLSGAAQHGTMPVKSADIMIDPQDLAASSVDVTVDVTRAKTGLIFVTQAMTGAEVLYAERYPVIRFTSTRVQLGASGRISDGAQIHGQLKVRDVVQPVVLKAEIYRQRGSATADLSQLSVRLSGQISRDTFGASGYKDLVADTVALDIRATVKQVE